MCIREANYMPKMRFNNSAINVVLIQGVAENSQSSTFNERGINVKKLTRPGSMKEFFAGFMIGYPRYRQPMWVKF